MATINGKSIFRYADYTDEEIRESVKHDVVENIPPQTNNHFTLTLDERVDRIMDCIHVLINPDATEIEKDRAKRRKYKYYHPDRSNKYENERRVKRYNEDPGYANNLREKAKVFVEENSENEEFIEQRKREKELDRAKKKGYIMHKLGGHCVICGCDDRDHLQVHHTNRDEKESEINELYSYKYRELLDAELEKCVLLCEDCHARITSIEKYLITCDNLQISIDTIFEIFRDHLSGFDHKEISRRHRNMSYETIRKILAGLSYRYVVQTEPEFIENELVYDLRDRFRIEPEQVKPIGFETPRLLESMRKIHLFNATHKDEKIPIPPIQYACGVTPYNMHEMIITKDPSTGIEYAAIPGLQMVTPFDFED
jgi:hypothetical protein